MSDDQLVSFVSDDDRNVCVVYGTWWDDGWISPYIRGNFKTVRGRCRMHIELFIPIGVVAPDVIVRKSGIMIRKIDDVIPDQILIYDIDFDNDDDTTLKISLTTSSKIGPSDLDERITGVLLKSWQLRNIS